MSGGRGPAWGSKSGPPNIGAGPRGARRVLWVSTDRRTRGGISSYLDAVAATGLWRDWTVRHLATHRDGPPLGKALTFACALARLVAVLAVDRPVLAHVHTASGASFVRKAMVAALLRAARVPVVLHVHGGGFAAFHTAASRPLRWWIRLTLERAAVVVALGDGWVRRLETIAPGARVVAVPNPVAPVAAAVTPVDGPVRVLCAGRMSPSKGTGDVLDAWLRRAPDSRESGAGAGQLLLVGDGGVDEARRRAEALGIADSVEVLGWQTRERVHELMISAHVLVLASYAEGQPLVVLEAMARGLAVVATAVGGVPDVVEDGRTGVLVPPGDPDALGAALTSVLEDADLRARLGAAAREAARAHDPDAVAAQLDALYREVTGRRGVPVRPASASRSATGGPGPSPGT